MRKLLYLAIPFAIGMAALASCNSGSSPSSKKDSVTMPYKATYSSSWVLSDSAKYVQAVLQSMKDYEDNKVDNAPAYFGDTVAYDFFNGAKLKLKLDSFIKVLHQYRDSLSSVKIEVTAWDNLHSTDKNQDWVGTWYKETDTYKTGKVDSAFYHDDNLIKNGKIVYVMNSRRTLPKGQ
jgi:hypothetical protein